MDNIEWHRQIKVIGIVLEMNIVVEVVGWRGNDTRRSGKMNVAHFSCHRAYTRTKVGTTKIGIRIILDILTATSVDQNGMAATREWTLNSAEERRKSQRDVKKRKSGDPSYLIRL